MMNLYQRLGPALTICLFAARSYGAVVTVNTESELNTAISNAQPGDTIQMANGSWTDTVIDLDTDGLENQPITLRAEADGKVKLEGSSKLLIAGDHLVVRGLHFTNGSLTDGEHVIEFRGGSSDLANHSRLTQCAITDYNPPDASTNYKWVSVHGMHNRVDHCAFTGMNHAGVTLTVWLNDSAPANHTRIDNNLFADRAEASGNGFETIRIGTSGRSMQDSEAVVENNYFYQCDGEIEIISNKSVGNIYRHNTFEDCKGQLTLRHGNECLIEGNFFIGNGKSGSSGVRVIGEDHVVVNNYFENLQGTGTRAAIAFMNGVPDSPLNRYFQVKRALIAFNTFSGCRENFVIGIDSSDTSLPPLDCVIANNIVEGSDDPLIEYRTTPLNMQYEGNLFHGASLGITQPSGIQMVDPLLSVAADGLMRPASNSPAIDAAVGSYPDQSADMDGHARVVGSKDVGADELATTAKIFKPLSADEVGPIWIRAADGPASSLVFPGPDGKLNYAGYANEGQASSGNLMIDFSRAGYAGGGVAIPWVPVAVELDPVAGGGDDHARIQSAIDTVSALPLSPAGFRGAVLLKAGSYNVSQTLRITTSGVVIRGEGQDSSGTVINFTATVQDDLFEFEGSNGWTKINETESAISDPLVPCGVSSLNVVDASNFGVGDRVIVHRTPNQAWIDELDMGQWGWTPSAYQSESPRTITAIDGNAITLDAPLIHAIESQYGGGEVYRYQFDGAIRQVGIERLRLVSAFTSDTDEDHGWDAVQFMRAENAWARQVTARYFGHSCVFVDERSQFVTVEDCAQLDPKSLVTGERRYSFLLDDSCFVLVQRCYTKEGRHDYITGSKMGGPSAFVDSLAENASTDIGPHHRYAEGILFDNIKGKEINVQNRRDSGTGHGWAGAQIVFWNCEADSLICDAPKAAMNFAIGCVGTMAEGTFVPGEPFGYWESLNLPVTPRSLYYKQLEERLGMHALRTVTTPGQMDSGIWNTLSTWAGDGEAPDLPAFAPLQVDAGADTSAEIGSALQLNSVIRYPLPSNFPVTSAGWTVVNGPGTVNFGDASAPSTNATFATVGTYELQYAISQDDHSDPGNVITYNGSDTLTVEVRASGAFIFDPNNFSPIGTISSATAALSFDTDSLQVSGGLVGSGELVDNGDGSFASVFPFLDIDLTNDPIVAGSRPLVLVSQGDLRIAADLDIRGSNGAHAIHGVGVAGGGNGGDANRSETPGNPYDGQGPGGSTGNISGNEDSSSGGGGFGGAGGDGTGAGGQVYGDSLLSSLSGGSGAGGTRNKGGGAGGGGIGLVANDTVEITSGTTIDARGGNGTGSGSQFTSGGGSGGGIFIYAKEVVINGTLDGRGGSGGNASGGQLNGGGGGGGRIAVFYQTSIDTVGSNVTVAGGAPLGSNPTGQPGADGTIHFGLNNAGLADQWLASETGISNPSPADWQVDYDGDGLAALLEYAFGGSTTTPDHTLLPEIVSDGGAGYDIAFNRRKSGIYPSDYMVETTTTLDPSDWDLLAPDEGRTLPHSTLAGFDRVFVSFPDDSPARFFRMGIRWP